jgi:hypothetical protein
MPEHALKAEVSAHQLQVGFADAGANHVHQHLTLARDWISMIGMEVQAIVENQRSHGLDGSMGQWVEGGSVRLWRSAASA